MLTQHFSQGRFNIHGSISALRLDRDFLPAPNAATNMNPVGWEVQIFDV